MLVGFVVVLDGEMLGSIEVRQLLCRRDGAVYLSKFPKSREAAVSEWIQRGEPISKRTCLFSLRWLISTLINVAKTCQYLVDSSLNILRSSLVQNVPDWISYPVRSVLI